MPEHFFGSDPDEIQKLCEEFQSLYPKAIIRSESRNYAWGKKSHEESQKEREEVAEKFKSWISSGMPVSQALDYANLVMEWGFNGQKSPKSLGDNPKDFCDFISAWNTKKSPSDMKASLVKNLQLEEIGIARSSKWLCFTNPTEFCIYDSRVSITLRELGDGGGKTFPTVGIRKTERTKDFPNPNNRTSEKMASDYGKFLDLINAVKSKYEIASASEIEMALFMLGDNPAIWRK